MNIKDSLGYENSITKGQVALRLFTDRNRERRLFLSYLNDTQARNSILYFYGAGGNGKSLLLRFLKEIYCRHFSVENWTYIKNLEDEALITNVEEAEEFVAIPCAYLNFGDQNLGDDRPREDYSALLMIRRELGQKGLRFPLFDYAIILYHYKTFQLSKERLGNLFPQDELNLAGSLLDAITESSYAGRASVIMGVFNKHLKKWFTFYKLKRGLNEEVIHKLDQMDAKTELRDDLPTLLARDINTILKLPQAPPHIVLMFDTHEAIWGIERFQHSSASYFGRDAWLRRLLSTLDLSNGIVAVVTGRTPPLWAKAPEITIPKEYIDIQLIGDLRKEDAKEFLRKAGVKDEAMQKALIHNVEGNPDQVHPFFLGLCVDIILSARNRDEELSLASFTESDHYEQKVQQLTDRLLSYCNLDLVKTIKTLAAARSFDASLFMALGKDMGYQATQAVFEQLTSFSFVWSQAHNLEQKYRIHDLLRRTFSEFDVEETLKAHHALEAYYRKDFKNGNELARVEAIYHLNQINSHSSIGEWFGCFNSAMNSSNQTLCEALLDIRHVLNIEDNYVHGLVSLLVGQYLATMSRYAQAEMEFLEAILAFNNTLKCLPDSIDAQEYRYIEAYLHKGTALQGIGELKARLGEYDEAHKNYNNAICAIDEALKLSPDLVEGYNNKGIVFQKIGELQTVRSRYELALESYQEAIVAYDEALKGKPDSFNIYNNKGFIYLRIGELNAQIGKHAAAKKNYQGAIFTINEALKLAPAYTPALTNIGATYHNLGALQTNCSEYQSAQESYQRSISAYDETVRIAPDFIKNYNNKGLVLQNLGDLQTELSDYDSAQENYREAIAAYDEALRRAPDYIIAYNNKGITLQNLGYLQARMSEDESAQENYEQAINTYDEVLKRAPDYIETLNNRGIALQRIGELQFKFGRHEFAQKNYRKSIASFDKALNLSPDYINAHSNKGIAFDLLGALQVEIGMHDEGYKSFNKAIAACDEALKRAPDNIDAHNNKGAAFKDLAFLQAILGKYESAHESFRKAIAAYDVVLVFAPDYVYAHNNKGFVLLCLGAFQADLGKQDEGYKRFNQAIAAFDEALSRAPDYTEAQINKDSAFKALTLLQTVLGEHESTERNHKK